MSKRTNEESKFTENIDRLLAGEKLEDTENISEDHRSAINFAQRLTESRIEPSPVFKAQLKERLLSKLAQEEARAAQKRENALSFWEFLKNLVPQSPAWRTVTATLLVALVAGSILWRTGLFTQSPLPAEVEEQAVFEAEEGAGIRQQPPVPVPETAPTAPPPAVTLQQDSSPLLELKTAQSDPVIYTLGETTGINLVFQNTSSENILITVFPPPIQILHAETGAVIRSFPEGSTSLSLSPSETVSHTLVWDQQDSSGKQVVTGLYSVHVGDVIVYQDINTPGATQSFQPFNLLIQNP